MSNRSGNSKLPSVTSDIPRDLRFFLERVRETLVTEGQVREIIRTPGPGGPGGPGDPGGPVDPPTTPIGLFALGRPGAIEVRWEPATYSGHNHTEVWASPLDDRRQAEAVGMAPGASYTHSVGSEVGRYYWIRFVNRNGVAGPYNSQAGLYAESLAFEFPEPPTPDLDDSRLNDLLNERLRWLEDPTFGLRGEAARIRGEFDALLEGSIAGILNDLNDIKNELDDILVTEVFDPTKGYAVDALVIWRNPADNSTAIYQCKQEIPEPVPPATAPLPSDDAYWNQVGDYAAIQAIVDDIASASLLLQARELLDEDGDVIGSMAAVLLDVRAVLEDGDGNLLSAGALLSLTSRVTTAEGRITALATALIEAGVLVDQNGTLVTSQAWLALRARIETLASNMLGNSEFMQADKVEGEDWPNEPPENWALTRVGTTATIGTNFNARWSPRSGDGVRALFLSGATAMAAGHSAVVRQADLSVVAGKHYQASVYAGSPLLALRVCVRITFNDVGATSFASPDCALTKSGLGPNATTGTTLTDYNRVAVFAQAPVGATLATVSLVMTPSTVNPAICLMTRPFFGDAVPGQTEPSPWVSGIQSNAYRAAASATLALDQKYKDEETWASGTAFLTLKGRIDHTETGLAAAHSAVTGVESRLQVDGDLIAAGALDGLFTDVQTGPNRLTSLATRISGVAATISNSGGNLLDDVAFGTVDSSNYADPEKVGGLPWQRTASGGWAAPTFGKNLAGWTIQRIPENVAYITKSGTPSSGSAYWHQDIPVVAGQWYQFSAWLQSHRCTARITLEFRSATVSLGSVSTDLVNSLGSGTTLAGYTRKHVALEAPSGTTLARLSITALTATAASPHLFALRPFFGEAVANQTEPSPWLPPVADAFAFQELTARVEETEEGLFADGGLVQGIANQLNDPEGGLVALAGAFNGLRSSVTVAYENRLKRSEQFNAAAWTRSHLTVGDGTVIVPGVDPIATPPAVQATSGSRLRETTANGQHFARQDSIPVEGGYTHTVSVHAKTAGGRNLVIGVVAQTVATVSTGTGFWTFNLATGAFIGTTGNADMTERTGAVEALEGGWHRCSASFKVTTNSTKIQVTLASANGAASYTTIPSFTGSTAAGLDLYGAQVNAGRFPDGYRKTEADALYGALADRVRATSSAITAVDTDLIDPVTGQRLTGAAFNALRSFAGPDGSLSESVTGLQAGAGPGGNLVADAVLESPVAGPVETSGPTAEMPDSTDAAWSFARTTANQWRMYRLPDGDDWRLAVPFGNTLGITGKITTPTAGTYAELRSTIPVEVGKRYQMSFYSGAHRCVGIGYIYWYNAAGTYLGASATGTNNSEMQGGKLLTGYKRLSVFAVPPAQAVSASVVMRAQALSPAQASPYLFVVRPYFGTAKAEQTIPSEWAAWNEPPIFAAMQAKGVVWADPAGEGSAGATYTMKLRARDNTGEAQVGFGLGAVKENGRWVSDVRFSANRFALMDSNAADQGDGMAARAYTPGTLYKVGDVVSYPPAGVYRCTVQHTAPATPNLAYWARIARYPFVYFNGITYLDAAVIRDGTISTAQIQNATITNAQIASLSASKIDAGNMKVGGYIRSNHYAQGSAGWAINANGTAEFGSAVIRGQLIAGQITDLSLGPRQLALNSATRIQRFSNTSVSGQGGTQQFNNLLYLAQDGNPFDRTQEAIIFFVISSGGATSGGVYLYNTHGTLMWSSNLPVAGTSGTPRLIAYAPNDSGPGNYIVEIRNKFPSSAVVTVTSTIIMSKR